MKNYFSVSPMFKSVLGALILTVSFSQTVWADDVKDPADTIAFEEGTVLIHCKSPEGSNMPKALFEEAFPKWAENLKHHANEGRVLRAHFLGKLKQGFAMVVTGKDKDEASMNAGMIFSELNQILTDAIKKTGTDSKDVPNNTCVSLEIGPVMLLPDNNS